jgi:hypothetical protein
MGVKGWVTMLTGCACMSGLCAICLQVGAAATDAAREEHEASHSALATADSVDGASRQPSMVIPFSDMAATAASSDGVNGDSTPGQQTSPRTAAPMHLSIGVLHYSPGLKFLPLECLCPFRLAACFSHFDRTRRAAAANAESSFALLTFFRSDQCGALARGSQNAYLLVHQVYALTTHCTAHAASAEVSFSVML